ncbi:hypothetical protein DYB28_002454, partial [Aphanomyces astaci]
YKIAPENVFSDWKEAAKVAKFADAVIIATQDAMHAVAFADLGYHILLEKPMAVTKEDCLRIYEATQRNNVMLSVCHVMRCSPYSQKLRELCGRIGKVVNIQHLEPVGFWHQVHSFVRGNWSRQDTATPNVDTITEALRTGPYGRCVYSCDNDVVDNQVVMFQYKDGSTASFTMVAFTESQCARKTKVFGTTGELTGDGTTIRHFDFLTRVVTEYTPSAPPATSKLRGHGGADYFLVENFVEGVRTNNPEVLMTGAAESLKSHLMVFAAEEARLKDTVISL